MEQAPTQAALVPSVQQFQTEFFHVLDDFPPIPVSVQVSSPVHTQDEPTLVSSSDPQPSIHIETPISEHPIPSEPQPGAPISSSSPPQPTVEPTSHESIHEPLEEPIQIDDSPQHSVDNYHPFDAYAQVFAKSSQPSVPSVSSAPPSEPQVQSTEPQVKSSKPPVSKVSPSEPVVHQAQTFIPSSTSTPS